MPGPDPDDEERPADRKTLPEALTACLPANLTLESVVDLTGEMEHLNELVLKSLERDGGFTTTDQYLTTVQPILDLLVVEVRLRYRPGMSTREMKQIIRDWIDGEIRALR